jgi:restriction endonuclease S subunit
MVLKWPRISLGDLLTLERRQVKVLPEAQYAEIGVYSFGRGIFHKQPRSGLEVGDKDLFLIREGDFILQITFAWEGAVALASALENGMYGSVRFPTFRVDEARCHPPFLVNYFKTDEGRNQLVRISPGSAGRNRVLSIKRIPEITVPLPPLAEQQRIVARIEALARRVEEARGLRAQAVEEAEALRGAASAQLFDSLLTSCRAVPIGETFTFRNDLIRPTDGKSGQIRFIGLQHVESHTGRRTGEDLLLAEELTGRKFKFSPGEIVYGYLRPYLNKVWVADCEGVCSVDQYVIRPKTERATMAYLAHFMRSALFLRQAIELTHNLLLPRLRTALLEGIPIPLPSPDEQRHIVAYLDGLQAKVDELKRLQAETQKELDALMPSILAKAFAGEL